MQRFTMATTLSQSDRTDPQQPPSETDLVRISFARRKQEAKADRAHQPDERALPRENPCSPLNSARRRQFGKHMLEWKHSRPGWWTRLHPPTSSHLPAPTPRSSCWNVLRLVRHHSKVGPVMKAIPVYSAARIRPDRHRHPSNRCRCLWRNRGPCHTIRQLWLSRKRRSLHIKRPHRFAPLWRAENGPGLFVPRDESKHSVRHREPHGVLFSRRRN